MGIGWALRIDGCPYVFTTADVTSIVSYGGDDAPANVTIAPGVLERPTGELSERLRPIDGDLDVTQLSFVLHDLPLGSALFGIADLFTRAIEDTEATFLAASAVASDGSITVESTAALGALPAFVWIGAEAIRVNSVIGAGVVNVTRGQYGSRAQAHTLDLDRGSRPEVWLRMPWVARRRATLYLVEDGAATPWWVGHADHAPRRAAAPHAASWTLSCTHAWVRERAARLGSPEPVGHVRGYDARGIALTCSQDNSPWLLAGGFPDRKSRVLNSFEDALGEACEALDASLRAVGGTDVQVVPTAAPGGLGSSVHVTVVGLGAFKLRLAINGTDASETTDSIDLGGGRHQARVAVQYTPRGALVPIARVASNSATGQRVTGFRFHDRTPTDWTTSSFYGVSITPLAVIRLSDDEVIELLPASDTPITENDSTSFDPPHASFTSRPGAALVVPADPLASPPTSPTRAAWAHWVDRPYELRRAWRVDAPHWAHAVRWVIETAYLGGASDPRNWTFAAIDRLAHDVDAWTAVRWRIDGTQELGDLVSSAARLFGCAVAIRQGKLALIALRQPTATEAVAATITAADLRAGELPHWETLEDGLVTHADLESPSARVAVHDVVAQERFGRGRPLELRASGFRAASSLGTDPLEFARLIAYRVLRLYSAPVSLVRLPVTGAFRSVALGDVVEVSAFNAPDGAGSVGLVSTRGVVIGRTYRFDTGAVDLEVLLLPIASGYAPCARVSVLSGGATVLELGASYAAGAGDYAGSGLSSYAGVPNDRGAGTFAAGYVVQVIERDNETPLTEAATVASVDTAARTVTLTGALVGGWAAILAGGGIVDVRVIGYSSATADERKYAYVNALATRQIAGLARAKRWAV